MYLINNYYFAIFFNFEFQEVESGDIFKNLTEKLGGSYTGVTTKDDYPNVGIITKHQVVPFHKHLSHINFS